MAFAVGMLRQPCACEQKHFALLQGMDRAAYLLCRAFGCDVQMLLISRMILDEFPIDRVNRFFDVSTFVRDGCVVHG